MSLTPVLVVLLGGIWGGPAAGDTPAPAPQPTILVGVLTQQFREVCKEHGQNEWVDPHWEVGFAAVTLPADAKPEALAGKPVAVKGKVPADVRFGQRKQEGTGCIPMQARGDWVIGKDTIRMVRSVPAGAVLVSAFTGDSLEPFAGLEAKPDKDEIVVTFTNTLGRPLEGVQLAVYYEGCYGKPGIEEQGHTVGALAAGAKATARFPVIVKADRTRGLSPAEEHLAWSVQVTTTSPDVVMDLDVNLPDLGVQVACPKQEGEK